MDVIDCVYTGFNPIYPLAFVYMVHLDLQLFRMYSINHLQRINHFLFIHRYFTHQAL